jgi:hypothetical protein
MKEEAIPMKQRMLMVSMALPLLALAWCFLEALQPHHQRLRLKVFTSSNRAEFYSGPAFRRVAEFSLWSGGPRFELWQEQQIELQCHRYWDQIGTPGGLTPAEERVLDALQGLFLGP